MDVGAFARIGFHSVTHEDRFLTVFPAALLMCHRSRPVQNWSSETRFKSRLGPCRVEYEYREAEYEYEYEKIRPPGGQPPASRRERDD